LVFEKSADGGAQARFAITLAPESLHFVFLRNRRWVEDASWPRFTLLGQSLGSMYLAWEALSQVIPDLFIGAHTLFPPR
jgi:alpha-1,2-mannosyltransferase